MGRGNAELEVCLSGVRAVVFDLDDTLYSERAFALSGFAAVGAWLRQRLACRIDPAVRMRELFDSGDRRRIFDRVLEELAAGGEALPGKRPVRSPAATDDPAGGEGAEPPGTDKRKDSHTSGDARRDSRTSGSPAGRGSTEPAEVRCHNVAGMVAEMIELYRSHVPVIGLYADAEAALGRWQKEFRLGLISDGLLGVQRRKIDALGLAGRLERIVLTDAWGAAFWKPHPRAFEEIEAAWGVRGPAGLYIADNPQKDFIAPRQLGWQTVRIRRPEGVYCDVIPPPGGHADAEVTSLDEISLVCP